MVAIITSTARALLGSLEVYQDIAISWVSCRRGVQQMLRLELVDWKVGKQCECEDASVGSGSNCACLGTKSHPKNVRR